MVLRAVDSTGLDHSWAVEFGGGKEALAAGPTLNVVAIGLW